MRNGSGHGDSEDHGGRGEVPRGLGSSARTPVVLLKRLEHGTASRKGGGKNQGDHPGKGHDPSHPCRKGSIMELQVVRVVEKTNEAFRRGDMTRATLVEGEKTFDGVQRELPEKVPF